MSARAGFRDRWISEVFRNEHVGDATRVLLLLLASKMTDTGRVSVPRSELARGLGRHEQRVAERIKEARAAGLLDQVGGGYRGVTAMYEALLPTKKGTGDRYPIKRKRTGFRYPNIGTLSDPETDLMGTARVVRQRARDLGDQQTTRHNGTTALPSPDVTKDAATSSTEVNLLALAVAMRTGCVDCNRRSLIDADATPCPQHENG